MLQLEQFRNLQVGAVGELVAAGHDCAVGSGNLFFAAFKPKELPRIFTEYLSLCIRGKTASSNQRSNILLAERKRIIRAQQYPLLPHGIDQKLQSFLIKDC